MSAFRTLDAARAAGIEVRLDGKDLVLSSDSAPPTNVLDMLRLHKLSIVALLQWPLVTCGPVRPMQPWDRNDWRAFFREQVRIYEGEGLARPASEARAYDCCVAEWLRRELVVTQPGPCPACGDPDRPNDQLLAVGNIGGRYWLHLGCVKAWCTARKAEAVAALAEMGIGRPGYSPKLSSPPAKEGAP